MLVREEMVGFKFKGKRTYVHGTDIFQATLEFVLRALGDYPSRLDGYLHHLLRNNALFCLHKDKAIEKDDKLCAYFSLEFGDQKYWVSVLDSGEPITSSREYDEANVVSLCSLAGDVAVMAFKDAYTYIEQYVAMTKYLHSAVYPDATRKGKWLFTRIQLQNAIDPNLYSQATIMEVEFEQNFHNRLTRSSLRMNNTLIGYIFFSLLQNRG